MNTVEKLTGKCTEHIEYPITFPYECDDFQKHAFAARHDQARTSLTGDSQIGTFSREAQAVGKHILPRRQLDPFNTGVLDGA